ncbi:MAG: hypothetical protein AABZ06_07495 [Bdellovibrionota bacterium]
MKSINALIWTILLLHTTVGLANGFGAGNGADPVIANQAQLKTEIESHHLKYNFLGFMSYLQAGLLSSQGLKKEFKEFQDKLFPLIDKPFRSGALLEDIRRSPYYASDEQKDDDGDGELDACFVMENGKKVRKGARKAFSLYSPVCINFRLLAEQSWTLSKIFGLLFHEHLHSFGIEDLDHSGMETVRQMAADYLNNGSIFNFNNRSFLDLKDVNFYMADQSRIYQSSHGEEVFQFNDDLNLQFRIKEGFCELTLLGVASAPCSLRDLFTGREIFVFDGFEIKQHDKRYEVRIDLKHGMLEDGNFIFLRNAKIQCQVQWESDTRRIFSINDFMSLTGRAFLPVGY